MKTVYEIRTPDLSGVFIGFDWVHLARAYWKEHVENAPATYRMHGAVVVEHTWEMPHEAETARLNWLESNAHALVWDDQRPGVEAADDGQKYFGDTLREALDLARRAPQSTAKVISPK